MQGCLHLHLTAIASCCRLLASTRLDRSDAGEVGAAAVDARSRARWLDRDGRASYVRLFVAVRSLDDVGDYSGKRKPPTCIYSSPSRDR